MLNKYENNFKENLSLKSAFAKSTEFFNKLDNKRSLKSTMVKVAKGDVDLFALDSDRLNTKNEENEIEERPLKESNKIFSRSHVNILNNLPNQTEFKDYTDKEQLVNDTNIANYPNVKKGMFSYPKSKVVKSKISLNRASFQNRLLSNEKIVSNIQKDTNKYTLRKNENKAKTTSFQTKESNSSNNDKFKSLPKFNGITSLLFERSSPSKNDTKIINTSENKILKSARSSQNEYSKNKTASKNDNSFLTGGKKSPEKKQIIYKSFNNLPINRIVDEENKLDYLSHLTTPKILLMKNNNNKLVPYIFKLVPTEFCYTYAVEHYNLEFVNISNEQDKGVIDLLFISDCTVSTDNSFKITLINGKEKLVYEIFCEDKELNSIYVESIRYISYVTKLKVQSLKKFN